MDRKFLIRNVLGPCETGSPSAPLCLHWLACTCIDLQIPVPSIPGTTLLPWPQPGEGWDMHLTAKSSLVNGTGSGKENSHSDHSEFAHTLQWNAQLQYFLIVLNHVDDWWLLSLCHLLTHLLIFRIWWNFSLPLLPCSPQTTEVLLLSTPGELTGTTVHSLLFPRHAAFAHTLVSFWTFGSFSLGCPSLSVNLENTY